MLNLLRISIAVVAVPLVAYAAPFEISGPYANRLPKADIEQLKTLVSKEPGIDHRLKKIEAVRPDKVRVQTGGRTAVDTGTYNDFNVYKRAGRWAIDTASIDISVETIVLPNSGQTLIR
jgi:hypothetical protein